VRRCPCQMLSPNTAAAQASGSALPGTQAVVTIGAGRATKVVRSRVYRPSRAGQMPQSVVANLLECVTIPAETRHLSIGQRDLTSSGHRAAASARRRRRYPIRWIALFRPPPDSRHAEDAVDPPYAGRMSHDRVPVAVCDDCVGRDEPQLSYEGSATGRPRTPFRPSRQVPAASLAPLCACGRAPLHLGATATLAPA